MQDDEARDNWYRSLTSSQRMEVDAKDRAEYAARRLANPRFGDGWYPIETAPKDGTTILFWDPVADEKLVIGCWVVSRWTDYEWTYHPTHWMPFPPDPTD
jgi:hypothetical protein